MKPTQQIIRLASAALAGALPLTAGCNGDSTEPRVLTTVQVTPSTSSLEALGSTVQLTASALDQDGDAMTGVTFTWFSSSPGVATVAQSGLTTAAAMAVSNGSADITATSDGVSGSATLTVAQVPASVAVSPDAATLVYIGEVLQYSAEAFDANNNLIANAAVDWSSDDPTIVDIDEASGVATALFPGTVIITGTADGASGDADLTVDVRRRPDGDIVFYRNYDPWGAADTAVLNAAPFNFVLDTDYFIAPVSDMQAGIPSTTSLVILPSASNGDQGGQITDQNAAAAELEAWVRAGGWLVVHGADNANGIGYTVPGLTGTIDDALAANGSTLAVADHALIRGPDAALGTADDLTDANIDLTMSTYDNHGSLASILPMNAEILIHEGGGAMNPTYATYDLDAGRVIVTSLTLEYGSATESLPTIINHFYWAIHGLDAPAAPAAAAAPAISHRPAAHEWLDSGTRARR